MNKLTAKQERFVSEYLIDLNATAAARRAGYSDRNADKIGPGLLGKSRVAAAISAAIKRRAAAADVKAKNVLRELCVVGFGDIGSIASWDSDGNLSIKPSAELTRDQLALLGEITMDERYGDDGKVKSRRLKVKLHDRLRALEQIAKDAPKRYHIPVYDVLTAYVRELKKRAFSQ